MRRFPIRAASLLLVCCMCAGCAAPKVGETTAPTQSANPKTGQQGRTEAAQILKEIWGRYDQSERFSVYGGMMEEPTMDAPGDLDMELTGNWLHRYHLPPEYLQSIAEGASLTHLMNDRLLTVAVFHLQQQEKLRPLADAWRRELQHGQWAVSRPARLLLAQVEEDFLLMAYGSRSNVKLLQEKMQLAFPSGRILYSEAITI